MPSTTTDAQLVADHLAGDRVALASMYDRYSATLYDTAATMTRNRDDAADIMQDVFVVAAERLDQLRDPARLKSWLFAILRNEVYRRTGRRRRVAPTDFTEPLAEMTLPSEPAEDGQDLEYQELAELVRGAAIGLDERDQLVLEYTLRQGLQGDDLAAALGVSAQQSYGLVHRMRQRTERSLGAYCVARRGRNDCDQLAEILRGWDGEFSVLIRKRVARHIDGCDTCERSRRKLAPLALFGAAPAFAAPVGLRERVLATAGRGATHPVYAFDAPGGFPVAIKYAGRFGIWIMLAMMALLFVGGTAAYVLAAGDDQLAIIDGSTTVAGPATATTARSANGADASGGGGDPHSSEDPSIATGTATGATSSAPSTPSTSAPTTSSIVSGRTTTTAPIVVVLPPTTAPAIAAADPTTSVVVVAPATPTTVGRTTAATTTTITTRTSTATTITTRTSTATTSTTTAVPAGALSLSSRSIDFGTGLDRASITLTNIGGQAVDWSASAGPAGFRQAVSAYSFSPANGTLGAGQSAAVNVTIDRNWPSEGPIAATRLTFAATGTSATVDLDATIARPPVIRSTEPPSSICARSVTGAPNPLIASATVIDESPPLTVRFIASGPDGTTTRVALSERRGIWRGALVTDLDRDGEPDDGLWTWAIESADAFGNLAQITGETVVVPTSC